MGFTAGTLPIWPVRPNWSEGVQESLAWSTEVLRATATARTYHRSLRLTPRRAFSFRVGANAGTRRLAAMLLAGYSGPWLLPIWPDVQRLAMSIPAGTLHIPCDPTGRDFSAGGKALIYTDATRWDVVDIDQVAGDHLQLAVTTPTQATAAGTRLYPLRRSRLAGSPEETMRSDDVSRSTLSFDIAEACSWPALAELTMHLGHPVLDARPDESTDPDSSVERLLQNVDYGTALPFVHDLARAGLRTQKSTWKLSGRARHTWFRSLLYTLSGRAMPMWLPSWAADLMPVGTVAANSPMLQIEWAGYTLYGLGRTNRSDLRIELYDGTVLYRRITAATAAGAIETLVLDQPLASTEIPALRIRLISFLALCSLASDEVEIEHVTDTDGLAKATLGWQAVVPDAP